MERRKVSALIIVSGASATGKTSIAQELSSRLSMPLISRDVFKEIMFDVLGWGDREQSKKYGITSYAIIFSLLESSLKVGQSIIVESNFSLSYDEPKIKSLLEKYPTKVVQVFCWAEGEVLLERFTVRSNSPERHPGHVDHSNVEEFRQRLLDNKEDHLDLGQQTIKVDTTDFSKVNIQNIVTQIKSYL